MSGQEVFSIGADSDDGDIIPIVRLTRMPRIDLDLLEPEVTAPWTHSPIKTVKVAPAKDGGQKPLWVFAHIWRQFVDGGESTSKAPSLAEKIRKRGIWQSTRTDCDHCGHVVGKQVGGKMIEYNLFPQNGKLNMGWSGNYFLWKVIDFLARKWVTLIPPVFLPNVEFQMRLYYSDRNLPDRPNKFKYSVGFFLTTKEKGDGDNGQKRIDLTKTIVNIAVRAMTAVDEANLMKVHADVRKAINEANMSHCSEYMDFLEELLKLFREHIIIKPVSSPAAKPSPTPAAKPRSTPPRKLSPTSVISRTDRSISVLDFIPVVGSVKGMVEGCEDISDGNFVTGGTNLVLGAGGLALDAITLGGASALASAGKGIAKAAGKVAVAKVAYTGSVMLKFFKR